MACMYCKGTGKYKRPKDLKNLKIILMLKWKKDIMSIMLSQKKRHTKKSDTM